MKYTQAISMSFHIADDVKTYVEARCLSAHHLDGCALEDFRRLLPLRSSVRFSVISKTAKSMRAGAYLEYHCIP